MTTQTTPPIAQPVFVIGTLTTIEGEEINVTVDVTPVSYTYAELDAAFREVQNPTHWKGPVDAIVGTSLVALYCEAVRYFTATSCTVEDLENGNSRIRAAGYWAGPAN